MRKLPVVLSPEEVALFLSSVDDPQHRMILTICYAGGLRISEAVRLKPAAIDRKRMVIRVEQGKGHKDRYVMLSPKLLAMLREYWRRTHPGEWLFPGGKPGQPISPHYRSHLPAGEGAVQDRQADYPAFLAPRLCRSSVGGGH